MGLHSIYGTWGTLWTEKKQKAATREMTVKYGSKWIGKMVTDCSGLLRWALHQLGEEIVHHARYQYTEYCTAKGRLVNGLRDDGQPIKPGTAVFLQGKEAHIHHVGVFVGDDTVIEAKGTVYGVVTSHLNHWDHWGELKMIDYSGVDGETVNQDDTPVEPQDSTAGTIIQAITINPSKWLNVRSGPGTEYPKVFQVEKGTVVDVLDAGEPDWWQIRYGGRIGWASAQYLKPVDPDPDQPAEAPEAPSAPACDSLSRDELSALLDAVDRAMAELETVRKLAESLKEAIE